MTNGAQLPRTALHSELRDTVDASCPAHLSCFRRGRHWTVFIMAIAALSVFSSNSYAQISARTDSSLVQIKKLFNNGSYTTAELETRRMLEDRTVSDSARVELEKYLGFTLVAQGRNDAAIDHFIKALKLDSSLTLDPVMTSPKILSVFETAKQKFQREMESAKPQKRAGSIEKPIASLHEPTFRALLFPGWDQLHRGRTTKGYILVGAGAAAAIAAIASDVLQREARTKYLEAATPSLAESRYKTYNFYYKSEFYSISAFVVIYLYSEFDSFLDLPPHFAPIYSPSTRSLGFNFRINF